MLLDSGNISSIVWRVLWVSGVRHCKTALQLSFQTYALTSSGTPPSFCSSLGGGHLRKGQESMRKVKLEDLPSNALVQILRHLSPQERNSTARTSRRMRHIATDRRLALIALHSPAESTLSHWHPHNGLPLGCDGLQQALDISQPGETVFVAPGIHCIQKSLQVLHAVKLIGLGASPNGVEQCTSCLSEQEAHLLHESPGSSVAVIQCCSRGKAALRSCSSLRLERIELQTHVAPCVEQDCSHGRLSLHDASLLNDPSHILSGACSSPIERSPQAGAASVNASRLEGGTSNLLKGTTSPVSNMRSAILPSAGMLLWFTAPSGWAASKRMQPSERNRKRASTDSSEDDTSPLSKQKRIEERSAEKTTHR